MRRTHTPTPCPALFIETSLTWAVPDHHWHHLDTRDEDHVEEGDDDDEHVAKTPASKKKAAAKPKSKSSSGGAAKGGKPASSIKKARVSSSKKPTPATAANADLEEDSLVALSLVDCYDHQLQEAPPRPGAKEGPSMQLSISLDKWTQAYGEDPTSAVLELLNLFLHVSGLPGSRLDLTEVESDTRDEALGALLENASAVNELIDIARQQQTFQEPYPFVDKKNGKKSKTTVLVLWRSLLDKIKHEALYDDVLLGHVADMLSIMACTTHRGIRHTGVEIAMATMLKLAELLAELKVLHGNKTRQQAGKKKNAGSMPAALAKELAEIDEKTEALNIMMNTIFTDIFAPRFRDTCPEIRLACLEAYGRCLLFVDDWWTAMKLKYLGWLCYDTNPLIRAKALVHIIAAYKKREKQLDEVSDFTERFMPRWLEMKADVDFRVTTEALKLFQVCLEHSLVPDSEQAVQEALPLVNSGDPALLKALMPIIRQQLQGTEDSQQALLALAKLLQSHGGDARDTCTNMVIAMLSEKESAICDWSAYCELLQNSDEEDEEVQVLLLQLMGAAAEHLNASVDADDGEGADGTTPRKPPRQRKTSKKEAAAQDESSLQLSAQLGKYLPQFLTKFQAHHKPLIAVLRLVRQLQFSAAQATLKGQRFDQLLQRLEAVCKQHTDAEPLQACSEAWRALLHQKDADAMVNKVQASYKKLCDNLLAAVRPLQQQTRSKGRDQQANYADAEIAMLRLEKLSANATQPLPILIGLAPRLLTLLKPLGERADEHMARTTQLLLQFQAQHLTLAIRELHADFAEGEGGGEGTAEFQQRKSQVLKAVKELYSSLTTAVQSPLQALRASAFKLLCSTLPIVKCMPALLPTGDGDDEEDDDSADDLGLEAAEAVRNAEDAAINRLSSLLTDDTAEGGDLEDEDEEDAEDEEDEEGDGAKRRDTALRPPSWLVSAMNSMLMDGLPEARALATLLVNMDEARDSLQLPQVLKRLWTAHLSKMTVEHQASLDVEILTCSYEECLEVLEDQMKSLRTVAQRLCILEHAAKDKARVKDVVQHVLRKGLAHAFDPSSKRSEDDEPGDFLDYGLVHMLKGASPDTSRRVTAQLTELQKARIDDAVVCPELEKALKKLNAQGSKTPRASSRAAASSVDQDDAAAGSPRRSRASARSAKSKYTEEDDEEDDEDDEEEEEDDEEEDDDLAGPSNSRDADMADDDDGEEVPWDGGGDDDEDAEEEDEGEEEEMAGGTEEMAGAPRRRGVYDAAPDDEEEEEEDFDDNASQVSQGDAPVPVNAAFRAKRKRA